VCPMFSAARVAVGCSDKSLRVLDAVFGDVLATLTGHRGEVSAVAVLPGAGLLVSAAPDCTIVVWAQAHASEFAPEEEEQHLAQRVIIAPPAETGAVTVLLALEDEEA
jgi:hypothetical protein